MVILNGIVHKERVYKGELMGCENSRWNGWQMVMWILMARMSPKKKVMIVRRRINHLDLVLLLGKQNLSMQVTSNTFILPFSPHKRDATQANAPLYYLHSNKFDQDQDPRKHVHTHENID